MAVETQVADLINCIVTRFAF